MTEELLRRWNPKTLKEEQSLLDKFVAMFSEDLGVDEENVQIFSIMPHKPTSTTNYLLPKTTDVRFYVKENAGLMNPIKLNGLLEISRMKMANNLGITIKMVGLNDCSQKDCTCRGYCTNKLDTLPTPSLVDVNTTGMASVNTYVVNDCHRCEDRELGGGCQVITCLNGGTCQEVGDSSWMCQCPPGFNGPRCQQTSLRFGGNGWAWYSTIKLCHVNHFSVQIKTLKPDGVIFYNGPLMSDKENEVMKVDYMMLELVGGLPRAILRVNVEFSLELQIESSAKPLNDGKLHQIDLFFDLEDVYLVVDSCTSASGYNYQVEDGTDSDLIGSSCLAKGKMDPFQVYLDFNTPLQIGGMSLQEFDKYDWQYKPIGLPFDGCIANFMINSVYVDLGGFVHAKNVKTDCDCARVDEAIPRFLDNEQKTPVKYYRNSFANLQLDFQPDNMFSTEIELRFQSTEKNFRLIKLVDKNKKKYAILEVADSSPRFRFNLNPDKKREVSITLSHSKVDDGVWHVMKVVRHGSTAVLSLDGGEGANYNATLKFTGFQSMKIDKENGVIIGLSGVDENEIVENSAENLVLFSIDYLKLDGQEIVLSQS